MDLTVVAVEFSGSTYQVEVWDSRENCSFWTFFQYSDDEVLKDAFCSCEASEMCDHLKVAFLKISDDHAHPWHIRYQQSFWLALFKIAAFAHGYESSIFQETDNQKYAIFSSPAFFLKPLDKQGELFIQELLQNRKKETPENSLKFSNLSEEEIQKWREGRPSSWLLFELSLWSDLSKTFFMIQENGEPLSIVFDENEPTIFHCKTEHLEMDVTLEEQDLISLIPFLNTIASRLKVFQEEDHIESIQYEENAEEFFIKYYPYLALPQGRKLGKYVYVKGEGFYSERQRVDTSIICKENVSHFLDLVRERNLGSRLKNYSLFDEDIHVVKYHLAFDSSWNLHINAYLFQKGDATFFDHYAFVSGKGFYLIKQPLFYPFPQFIAANAVSEFIARHKAWLNQIPSFSVHLFPVESALSYEVDLARKKICFLTSAEIELLGKKVQASYDFGAYLYFRGEGFFPKQESRLKAIPSGLEIAFEDVAAFVRSYKEELSPFFLSDNPFLKRGLHVELHPPATLVVKPEFIVRSEYQNQIILFFEEYAWVQDQGFFELPYGMRLPEYYQKEISIGPSRSALFFEEELPQLMAHVTFLDPRLQRTQNISYHIHKIQRTDSGSLLIDFNLISQLGKVSLLEIREAMQKKYAFFFSDAGALFLKDDSFAWLKDIKIREGHVELSPLQFLKWDALFGFTADLPDPLLQEIRQFSSSEARLTGFKSTLRPYQMRGLEWLYFLYQNRLSGLLCDDMGLGKTHQAMALMAAIMNHEKGKEHLFLVVAPTSVIYHWQNKLKDFLPKVKVHLFHGAKRGKRFPKKGLILTSYGILRLEKDTFSQCHFDCAIYDEVQLAKNPHSQIHKVLSDIKADMHLGLTGTPIENTLFELKALFDIILPGYMPHEKHYKQEFVIPIEKEEDNSKKELLTRLIKPFVLRRRKKEVLQDLPEKSEDKSYCDLSEEQTLLYSSLLEARKKNLIKDLKDHTHPIPYMSIFSLLTSLKQICNHPALFQKRPEDYKQHDSGKWDLFTELLNEAIESEQKVVIFSQYLHMLDIFKHYFAEREWQYAEIRGATKERGKELARFQSDPKCKIFIGSLQAAGLGIDLTAASIVILYDRWWNAARENQAIDRVHRIGQKWKVLVYKLITKNTIEEKIDLMISHKGRLMEQIVTIDDENVLKIFTRQELLKLFQ